MNKNTYIIPVSPKSQFEASSPCRAPVGLKRPTGLVKDGADQFFASHTDEEISEIFESALVESAERDFLKLIAVGRKPDRFGFEKSE